MGVGGYLGELILGSIRLSRQPFDVLILRDYGLRVVHGHYTYAL